MVVIGIIILLLAISGGVPIFLTMVANPKAAMPCLVILIIALLTGGYLVTAWYCPWMYLSGDGLTPKDIFAVGFILLMIGISLYSVFRKQVGSKWGPTSESLADLEKEVELMTKLRDRRIAMMALVPLNARDPVTGNQATLAQLSDYRWCAKWLLANKDPESRN